MLDGNRTPLGKPGNLFSVGPAVLWSPLYLLTHGTALILGLHDDGYSYFYQAPILFLSIVYGFLGLWMTWRVAAEVSGPRTISTTSFQWVSS